MKNKIPETLLFVAVEAVHGSDRAEQTVLFAVNACGEKQSVRGPGGRIIAKRERPQSVNGQDGVIWILQETHEFVGESVKGGDPTTAEVANQNGIAKLTEITRGPNNSPGRIEPRTMLEMADVLAGWREEFNEAKTVTGKSDCATCSGITEDGHQIMLVDKKGMRWVLIGDSESYKRAHKVRMDEKTMTATPAGGFPTGRGQSSRRTASAKSSIALPMIKAD